MTNQEDGFTLPELIVVIVVSSIFISLIMFFAFSYWRYGYLLEADLDTLVTRLNAGDIIRENISASSGLIIQNSIPDNAALVPDTSISGGQYWQPIHAIPGNKPIGNNGIITPLVYFRRPSLNTSGNIIMNGTQPYEDEYILYMDGSSKKLFLRSLANPVASGNRLKTSCTPPGTATCPADRAIAQDIASIDMRYFSRTGNLIDYTSIIDPNTGQYIGPDFPAVEVVEFTLNITKKPIFQKTNATQNSTVIRIALRNS
jgi:prepilin-type N-terminal cleavage/methylation domain-containing protein